MNPEYDLIPDIEQLAPDIPPDSIISRTFHEDERMKVILFAFAQGQELSEHTASQPAMLLFLGGEADLKLGEDEHKAHAGTWVHMPAKLPHSIKAETETIMLLMLYKEVLK
jgi:quercetin dioxygenase-like cupin family protein